MTTEQVVIIIIIIVIVLILIGIILFFALRRNVTNGGTTTTGTTNGGTTTTGTTNGGTTTTNTGSLGTPLTATFPRQDTISGPFKQKDYLLLNDSIDGALFALSTPESSKYKFANIDLQRGVLAFDFEPNVRYTYEPDNDRLYRNIDSSPRLVANHRIRIYRNIENPNLITFANQNNEFLGYSDYTQTYKWNKGDNEDLPILSLELLKPK